MDTRTVMPDRPEHVFITWEPPPAWTLDALCAQIGMPDLWFPEPEPDEASGLGLKGVVEYHNGKGGGYQDLGRTATARRVCMKCPVRQECLDFAIENDEEYGVWGGLTYVQRRRLVAAREAAKAA